MGTRAFILTSMGLWASATAALGCTAQGVVADDGGGVVLPTSDAGVQDAAAGAVASMEDGAADVDAQKIRAQYQGSPLCNAVRWKGCYPDDPRTSTASECALAPDGGPYNVAGGYDNVELGCHVVRANQPLGVQPVCTPAGAGGDGATCTRGLDCAPGYECVGDGTCRHYCCAGSCGSEGEFCDLQATSDTMLEVPVCMPLRPCGLLDTPSDAGSCSGGETCAVARDNGATSCV